MNTTRHLPISTKHLARLIEQGLLDLRHARRVGDAGAARRAERRMNALLEQMSTRTPAAANPTSPTQLHLSEPA